MLGEMKCINRTHIISNLTGIVVENSPICTLCNISGGGGGVHWDIILYTSHLCPVLHAGKEPPFAMFLFFARALRDFPANVPLLFYSSVSWNRTPSSTHQMLH